MGDPNLKWDGSQLHSDLYTVPLLQSTSQCLSEDVRFEQRQVDASGNPLGDGSWGGIGLLKGKCSYTGVAHRASSHTLLSGWAGFEFRFRGDVSNTIYGRAFTCCKATPPAAPTDLRVASISPPGRILTYDMVGALALHPEGGNWTKPEAVVMTAVAMAESSFRTKAISYTGCCHGIWQINVEVHPYTIENMRDPYKNVVAARAIWNKQGRQAWEAYTNGSYEQFVADATAAVDRQIKNGYLAWDEIPTAEQEASGKIVWAWSHEGSPSFDSEHAAIESGVFAGRVSGSAKTRTVTVSASESRYLRVRACNPDACSAWVGPVGATMDESDPSAGIPPKYQGGLTGGDAKDPEDDTASCGWNVFCWIKAALKWAFWPGEDAFDAWNEFYGTLRTRPPFSVVIGGFSIVTTFLDNFMWRDQAFPCINDIWGPARAVGGESQQICLSESFAELQGAATSSRFHYLSMTHWLLTAILYVVTTVKCWRILQSAFGRSSGEDGEGASTELDEERAA
jgi:hypothetical protein